MLLLCRWGMISIEDYMSFIQQRNGERPVHVGGHKCLQGHRRQTFTSQNKKLDGYEMKGELDANETSFDVTKHLIFLTLLHIVCFDNYLLCVRWFIFPISIKILQYYSYILLAEKKENST